MVGYNVYMWTEEGNWKRVGFKVDEVRANKIADYYEHFGNEVRVVFGDKVIRESPRMQGFREEVKGGWMEVIRAIFS